MSHLTHFVGLPFLVLAPFSGGCLPRDPCVAVAIPGVTGFLVHVGEEELSSPAIQQKSWGFQLLGPT